MDINCDMGEGLNNESQLMPWITSTNIACGFHAGNSMTMVRTVELALEHGVSIGAHPSYPDRENFGRQEMDLSADEVESIVLYQVGALKGIVEARGGRLRHVKAHGALYNRAAWDWEAARGLIRAVASLDPSLALFALAGSSLAGWAREKGLTVVEELFPDRGYLADGSLAPRSMAGALVEDPLEVARRGLAMAKGEPIPTLTGGSIRLQGQTLCIHGDHLGAHERVKTLYETLLAAGLIEGRKGR